MGFKSDYVFPVAFTVSPLISELTCLLSREQKFRRTHYPTIQISAHPVSCRGWPFAFNCKQSPSMAGTALRIGRWGIVSYCFYASPLLSAMIYIAINGRLLICTAKTSRALWRSYCMRAQSKLGLDW